MEVKEKKTQKIYSKEEAIKASTEYFKGDVMAAEVWVKKYALRDAEGNIYELFFILCTRCRFPNKINVDTI